MSKEHGLKNNNGAVITRLARRALIGSKGRSLILTAAVMLSTFMISCILTIGCTWFNMQEVQNVRLSGGDIDATLYGGFTEKQKEIAKENDDISAVGTEGFAAWAVRTDRDSTLHSNFIWSDKTMQNEIRKEALKSKEGHYPTKINEVMTTKDALKDCGYGELGVGDKLTITYEDNNGEHTGEFIISGLWDGYGDNNVFYVSREFFDNSGFKFEDYGRGFLFFKYDRPLVTDKMMTDLENSLDLGKQQVVTFSGDTAGSVNILLGVIGLIIAVVLTAYLLIYNIMYLSVQGNVRYYGLLQTVGMTGKQIRNLVHRQIILLGSSGIVIGLAFSTATSFAIIPFAVRALGVRENDIDIVFHPLIFLVSILIAGLTVFMGGRKPAKLATGVSPIEALGYRRISSGRLSKKTGRGRLIPRMAWQQFMKDKKKTAVIILTLGICMSVFLCMITLIKSQGARTIVSNYELYDLVIKDDTMQMEEESTWKRLIDDELTAEVKNDGGVKAIHKLQNVQIAVPWEEGFIDQYMDEMYEMWMVGVTYDEIRSDYIKHPEKYYSFAAGIDRATFRILNETLEKPINEKAFMEGRTCIMLSQPMMETCDKAAGEKIDFSVCGGTKLHQIKIAAVTDDSYYMNLIGTTPSIVVSNAYLEKIADPSGIGTSKLAVTYNEEYDEATEARIKAITEKREGKRDYSYDSKIQVMKSIKETEGNMMGIGIGIALLLAFIGFMNYINASVGNIQSRKVELSVMESLGMTRPQMKKLLMTEGLLFAAGCILITMTIGMGAAYLLFQHMNYREIPFSVPVIPVAAAEAALVALCVVIPLIAYRSMEKSGTVIERIKGFE